MNDPTGSARTESHGGHGGQEGQAEAEDRLRHGSSFGAAAGAYAEHRPDYAETAVRWALEPIWDRRPVRGPRHRRGRGLARTANSPAGHHRDARTLICW
ncbi:MAG: hypothetical protein ACRDOE_24520 [Streptosporangiaceae bacterium]